MELVGLWGERGEVADWLARRTAGRCRLVHRRHPAELAGERLDLLILAPDATGLAGAGVVTARLALVPGGQVAALRRVRAQSAVSYGLGPQNTLTLSSLEGDSLSLALQRELMTVSGAHVERQEWVLPFDPSRQTAEEALCCLGALLLLDCPLE